MASLNNYTKFLIKQNEQKKSNENRALVRMLSLQPGSTKKSIAKSLGVSIKFVRKWSETTPNDINTDGRGWPKGKSRQVQQPMREEILKIHSQLADDPDQYFTGATAVKQLFEQTFPDLSAPSLRTIGRILKEAGRTHPGRYRQKGASAYLCYPEHLLYHDLGGRLLEADFIGHKFITGQTAAVNFIGFSFKQTPRLRYFARIQSQTSRCFIEQTDKFFQKFEKPDFIKMDNALAMIGSASGKRNLSESMIFLLKNRVVPIFAVPRKPFTQASIEGNNSIFSRFFWNKTHFNNFEEIDLALNRFNQSSLWYLDYKMTPIVKPDFSPKVIFIRQVSQETSRLGTILVLNELIQLDPVYSNYYVFVEWNLVSEQLSVFLQKEKQKHLIHQSAFLCNKNSLNKLNRGEPFI